MTRIGMPSAKLALRSLTLGALQGERISRVCQMHEALVSEKAQRPPAYRIVAEKGGKTFTVEIADKTGTMKLPGFGSLAAADEWVTEQMHSDAEIGANVWVSREPPPNR